MGLPEIFISFQTAGVSAIARSGRGVVALVLDDDTREGGSVYRTLAEVSAEDYTAENYRLLQLCFLAAPNKVMVVRHGTEDAKVLDGLRFDYLAAPGMEQADAIAYAKANRDKGVKLVTAGANAPDCEGVINLCADGLVLTDGAIDASGYTCRIAGLLAALPLTRSATYAQLPEVVDCKTVSDPDGAVDAGKLLVIPGSEGYRLGRAVNSLTTLTPTHGAAFQKIKVLEGIDLIKRDIAATFEKSYIGTVLNDYDNKLLLVTAINAYFRQLEGTILDKTAENVCTVSLSGQRDYLESRGISTADMTDAEILRANTGSQVFLSANLTFCDAMEDLQLVISM